MSDSSRGGDSSAVIGRVIRDRPGDDVGEPEGGDGVHPELPPATAGIAMMTAKRITEDR
jgi:hypothetical protein